MSNTVRKLNRKDVARFHAIRASRKLREAAKSTIDASNDNDTQPSAYVNTTMSPAMLAACTEAAGYAE